MTMPYMDDFYPERKPLSKKQSDEPNYFMWGVCTVLALVSIIVWAFSFGLLLQFWALLVMVPLATGKYTLVELHTLEDVDDPFTH